LSFTCVSKLDFKAFVCDYILGCGDCENTKKKKQKVEDEDKVEDDEKKKRRRRKRLEIKARLQMTCKCI